MVYLIWEVHPKINGTTKMLKMQKIPNLLLFVSRDHQLVYFTMLSPYKECSPIPSQHSVHTKLLVENATITMID
jgi:hypothetical protein